VFLSNRTGAFQVWLKDLQTGDQDVLTTTPMDKFMPVFPKNQNRLIIVPYTVYPLIVSIPKPDGGTAATSMATLTTEADMTYVPRCLFVSGVLLALICIGCASYPEEQLKQAQAAMDEVLKLQPEAFAAGDWQDAKKTWDDAQALLAQQKYSQAAPLLITAKSRFIKAGQIAKDQREAILQQVTQAQQDINLRHAGLRSDLAAARLSAQVRKSLEECCQQVQQQIDKLNTEIGQGDLLKAQATAKETLKLVYEGQLKMEAATKKHP
jgi:hypothetical protein